MSTPVEMQTPTFPAQTAHHSPRSIQPAIPSSPATEFGDLSAVDAPHPLRSASMAKEIGGSQPNTHNSLPEEYDRPPPSKPHPALFAPVVSADAPQRGSHPAQTQTYPSQHLQQRNDSLPTAPNSPGPIPLKTESDENDKKPPYSPTSPYLPIHQPQPYAPHFAAPPRNPIYAPDSATGPNGMPVALHAPGQIPHPNMSPTGGKQEWKHGLCECSGDVGTCLTGYCCPCVLYGKTTYRLSLKSEKKDATDMLGWQWVNGSCLIMGVACGLHGLFPLIHRTRVRHLYGLQGSLPSDAVQSCCCCCCSVIQNEREVRDREETTRRWAGPASGQQVYQSPAKMVYQAPARG
ncbi:PLAC8-domain-containing protein [Saccharata proteae CBS 121410]|uniref:PLAC8-domain-containing protein n=1 Tax=Saccharata proteae CBS 121410 TaxID=1314787 RepID=A0A9P4LWG7_9PEZI|nr:PLAC8-domain-containing protein [Saccharata proteae CBS 121410]